MAVLTHDEILERVKSGEIIIEPFSPEAVGPASIDLHLDSTFRVFKKTNKILHVTEDIDFNEVTSVIEAKEYYTLLPGQAVHGITMEKITLPPTICGHLEGRSRFARVGLMVHITASFIQPGTSGKQVLEMNNTGPIPLAIHPGIAICQLILEECKGRASYVGKFHQQISP